MKVDLSGDLHSLILTMHIDGVDGDWLTYDKDQLHDLICELIKQYGKMKYGGVLYQ